MEKEERKQQITSIVEKYYNEYKFLQQTPLSEFVDKALSLFLDSDLSMEEVHIQILEAIRRRAEEYRNRYNPEIVKENHEIVYGMLKKLLPLLQREGVDYYLGGALCGYLKYGEESTRTHDDLDFMVNERDLAKFQKICEELGFQFFDHRMTSPRVLKNEIPSGEHEVIATSTDFDFHIGVFCFEKLVDGTVVVKGYYHNDQNEPYCREEVIGAELAEEIFETDGAEYAGYPVSITAPEHIYQMKNYTNSDKDKKDIAFLKEHIDFEKEARIRELKKTNRAVQYNPVDHLPEVQKEEPSSELHQMTAKEAPVEQEAEAVQNTEKPKIFVKTDDSPGGEDGFVHKYAIVITILILAVVILIGFIALKWFQII